MRSTGVAVAPIIGYAGGVTATVLGHEATSRVRGGEWLGDVPFSIRALDWVGQVDVSRA